MNEKIKEVIDVCDELGIDNVVCVEFGVSDIGYNSVYISTTKSDKVRSLKFSYYNMMPYNVNFKHQLKTYLTKHKGDLV